MNYKFIDRLEDSGKTKPEKDKDTGIVKDVPIYNAIILDERPYPVTAQELQIRLDEIQDIIKSNQEKIASLNQEKAVILSKLNQIR